MYAPIFPNRRGKSTKKNRNPLIFRELISKIERLANTFEQYGKTRKRKCYDSSSDLICFFGVTPIPFKLSTLRITLPLPS